ncbi:MAG: hypothetical protein IID40_06655 [Planctomycetes bacterium]|nr:hypothetical protein [Planctomycetota bacterium]
MSIRGCIAAEGQRLVTVRIAKPIHNARPNRNAQATTAGNSSTRLKAFKRQMTTMARDLSRAAMEVYQRVRGQRHEPSHPVYQNVTWQDPSAGQE